MEHTFDSTTGNARWAPSQHLEAVFWDFDGTIADTCKDVWASLQYAAGGMGSSFSEDFMSEDCNLSLPMCEILAHAVPPLGPDLLGAFDECVSVHYRTLSNHELTEFYPGVEDVLQGLGECGIPRWIVTNKPQVALARLLRKKGWSHYFDGCVSPDSLGPEEASKTQMLRAALERVGADPARCCMIGDSWGDVFAAREAGVLSVAVTYGDGDVEKLLVQKPDVVVTDSVELQGLLLRG